MANTYDVNDVTERNIRLELGDIVSIHGRPHIVNEINYEGSVNAPLIIKYELDAIDQEIPFFDEYPQFFGTEFRLPMRAEIRQLLNSENMRPPIEEEISEETRNKFIKLLE